MPVLEEPWLLLTACAVLTYLWRGIGVALSGSVNAESEAFAWISCVAYAMIAGLVARMLVMPTGALAETSLLERFLGSAAALGAYFWATRRNLFAGVAAGAAAVWVLKQATV